MVWHESAAEEFEKSKWTVKPLMSKAHGHWGTKAEHPDNKFAVSFSTQDDGSHIATVMHKARKGFEITHTIYAEPEKNDEVNQPLVFSLPPEKKQELALVIRRAREYLKKHAPAD